MSEVEDFLQKHAERLKKSSDGEPLETKEKELIDKLQDEIQFLRDSRCEERFIWAFAVIMVFNVAVIAFIKSVPSSLLFFELVFLFLLSTHLGVERMRLFLRELYEDVKKLVRYWIDKRYESKKNQEEAK